MNVRNRSLVVFFFASVLCSPAGGAAPAKVETSSDPSFDPRLFPKLAVIVVEEGAERTSVAVTRSETERSTAILFSDQTRLERAIEDEFITALMNKRYTLSTRSDLLSILKEHAVQDLAFNEDNSAGIGKVLKVQAVMLVRLEAVRQAKTPKFREWTDDTGKHKTKAKFVTFAMGIVTLELESGKTLTVPVERLSKADQDFIKLRSGRVIGTEDLGVAVGARLISVDGAKILWTGKCSQLVSATDTSPLVTAAKNVASAFPKREGDLPPPDKPETAKPGWLPGRIPVAPPRAPAATDSPEAPAALTNSIGMKFVLIPPGEFDMGSTEAEVAKALNELRTNSPQWMIDLVSSEAPRQPVRITKPFYLGVCEVTQMQYQAIMGNNPSKFKGDPTCPVETVSWEDASAFCRKLGELSAERTAGAKYRLPTEAEWEYACRAGTKTTYHSGDDVETLLEHAWLTPNAGGKTHPVGQKSPNAWGLYDMHGNVFEWCQDRVGDGGKDRVDRGGSYSDGGTLSRAAFRIWDPPSWRAARTGFRVARSVSD